MKQFKTGDDHSEDNESRYLVCSGCGHITTWMEHTELRVCVDCPDCGRSRTAGPGVYEDDYSGYSLAEAAIEQDRIRTSPYRRLSRHIGQPSASYYTDVLDCRSNQYPQARPSTVRTVLTYPCKAIFQPEFESSLK